MFSHDRRWLAIDGCCTLQVDSGHRNLGVISSSIFDTTNAKKVLLRTLSIEICDLDEIIFQFREKEYFVIQN